MLGGRYIRNRVHNKVVVFHQIYIYILVKQIVLLVGFGVFMVVVFGARYHIITSFIKLCIIIYLVRSC